MKMLRVVPIGKRKPVFINPYKVLLIQACEGGCEVSFGDEAPPLLVKDCIGDLTIQFESIFGGL